MLEAVYIEGTREGYSPAQVEDGTLTVGELIALLSEFDEDTKVFIQNDNGYTFGKVSYSTVTLGSYGEDDEYDLGTDDSGW